LALMRIYGEAVVGGAVDVGGEVVVGGAVDVGCAVVVGGLVVVGGEGVVVVGAIVVVVGSGEVVVVGAGVVVVLEAPQGGMLRDFAFSTLASNVPAAPPTASTRSELYSVWPVGRRAWNAETSKETW
jgi:hypothetical protein